MASAPDPWRSNSHRRPSLSESESVASVVSVRAVPKSGPSTSSDSSKNSIDDHDPPQYPDDPDAVFCPRYGNQDAWPDTAQTNESTGANANATGAGAAAGVAAQLETAEFERDQYRKKAEERNVTTHSLNPDNIRELYKLREDYAKLQAHAMELMDRAEASEKVLLLYLLIFFAFAMVGRDYRGRVELGVVALWLERLHEVVGSSPASSVGAPQIRELDDSAPGIGHTIGVFQLGLPSPGILVGPTKILGDGGQSCKTPQGAR